METLSKEQQIKRITEAVISEFGCFNFVTDINGEFVTMPCFDETTSIEAAVRFILSEL